jgi:hypothetical protein
LISSEPIVNKSIVCTLRSVDNGAYGPCVFIHLDRPFAVKAEELKVPINGYGEGGREIIDNYFLEFKIIPTSPNVGWPPIPVLGQSNGDSYSGKGRPPSEALPGALVMKYNDKPMCRRLFLRQNLMRRILRKRARV